jgi:hypothetical protein
MRRALAIVTCVAMFLSAASARADSPIRVRKADTPVADFGLALSIQTPQDLNQLPLCAVRSLPCLSPKSAPDGGWTLTGARSLSDEFALIGEIGGYRQIWDSFETVHSNHREINPVYSAMAGIRVASHFNGHRQPIYDGSRFYARLLVGRMTSEQLGSGAAIEPGIGIDVRGRSPAMFRLGLDFCVVGGAAHGLTTSRAFFGVAFGVGSRDAR